MLWEREWNPASFGGDRKYADGNWKYEIHGKITHIPERGAYADVRQIDEQNMESKKLCFALEEAEEESRLKVEATKQNHEMELSRATSEVGNLLNLSL